MRSPSARVLINSVDHYAAVQLADRDGGNKYGYPALTSGGLPCSAQPGEPVEAVDEQGRVTQMTQWKLIFADPIQAKALDKFIYIDNSGVVHTLFVEAGRDG